LRQPLGSKVRIRGIRIAVRPYLFSPSRK
jgi:hypothetical protein